MWSLAHPITKLLKVSLVVVLVATADLSLFLVDIILDEVECTLHVVGLSTEIVGPCPHKLVPCVEYVHRSTLRLRPFSGNLGLSSTADLLHFR